MIVAHAGVQGHHAAGTLAKLGWLAAGSDCDGAKRIYAGLHYERSAGGLGYVETVENQQRLVGLGAGYMGLTVGVGRDSGHEDQGVAIVVRTGVGNVEKFLAAEFFLGGNLRGVDSRWRFDHVHYLPRLALVRKSHVYIGGGTNLYIKLNGGIETGFFHAQFAGCGGQVSEFTMPGEVGAATQWEGRRRGLQLDAGGADGQSIFVRHGDCELLNGGGVKRGRRR